MIADSPGLCYRCDNSIKVGSEVTEITTADGDYYRMHKECADDIYIIARTMDAGEVLQKVREAQSEEERLFWVYIADMNMQRKVIR